MGDGAPAIEVEEEDRGVDAVAIPADPLAYSMQTEEARLLEWTEGAAEGSAGWARRGGGPAAAA